MNDLEIDAEFSDMFWRAHKAVIVTSNTPRTPEQYRRYWFSRLVHTYNLHPVVRSIVDQGVRPADWQRLLLEWPHVSTDDEMLLAYTRDDKKGEDNVQTKTSIGKYLSRHWPHVADNIRRDWAGTHTRDKYEVWNTKETIIRGIELGPVSCMQSGSGSIPFDRHDHQRMCAYFAGRTGPEAVAWDHHPYACYAPEHGWSMAVRLDPGKPNIVMGRALLLDGDDGKWYVRSYKRAAEEGGYSYSDEKLETWLREQGYSKIDGWPDGAQLALITHPRSGGYMAPYIDGDTQTVQVDGGCLVIDSDGYHECDNTDGTMGGGRETIGSCEDCGETVYEEDERIWAGRTEDRLICSCCMDGYYYVEGDNGRSGSTEYYVHSDNEVTVNNVAYDRDNLPYFIKELHDGDYAHEDECVYIDSVDEYYLIDDEEICYTADGDYALRDDCVLCADGEWRPEDECWQCEMSKEWYSDDEENVEVDGKTCHPDNVPENETTQGE